MRTATQNTIPAGAMADVAFLLLLFFLVATRIYDEKGIPVTLPPFNASPSPVEVPIFHIHINARNEVLAGDVSVHPEDLSEHVYRAVARELETAETGKAVISLHCDRKTSYSAFFSAHEQIRIAYRKLWDDASMSGYGVPFDRLGEESQQQVRTAIPMIVSEAEWEHGRQLQN